jgi:uncharacterized protein (TIGR03437 family)
MRILKQVSFTCGMVFATAVIASGQQPVIAAIENNYSYTLPTVPNYGIAPGSLFVIYGSNLSTVSVPVLQSSAAPGVPLSLNGTSVSVTANSVVAQVPLYYVSATQVAGILPSTVPAGNASITVTNNGQTSVAATLRVIASGFGVLTSNNIGSGQAAAYDAKNKLLSGTNSASPGQTIVIYGSGIGADPANDDRIFPQKQDNLTNIPVQVFIGGSSTPILYRGRSQFPGVDQINVTVPSGSATGCFVSFTVMSGNYVSNSTTLPIAANGGTCSDPNTGLSAAQSQTLRSKSNVSIGTIFISQELKVSTNVTRTDFRGMFLGYANSTYSTQTPTDGFLTYGSCQVSSAGSNGTHLNAGSMLTIMGPGGEQQSASLTTLKDGSVGDYKGILPSGFIPAAGGTFAFTNGSGSTAIGPMNGAGIMMFPPLVWTNMNQLAMVNRAQGATVTWSGGSPGTFVVIRGTVAVAPGANSSVSYACAAPVSAGRFTIPPSLLLAIPVGMGDLVLNNVSIPTTFSASGLDAGIVFGQIGTNIPVSYQ